MPEGEAGTARHHPSHGDVPRTSRRLLLALAALAGSVGFLPGLPGFSPREQPQQRTLGVVLLVSTLWVTEALPVYVSALAVPPLVVLFGCLRADCIIPGLHLAASAAAAAGNNTTIAPKSAFLVPAQLCADVARIANSSAVAAHAAAGFVLMPPRDAAATIVGAMWSPVILLFLAGFVIAATLDKHRISQRFIERMVARVGDVC